MIQTNKTWYLFRILSEVCLSIDLINDSNEISYDYTWSTDLKLPYNNSRLVTVEDYTGPMSLKLVSKQDPTIVENRMFYLLNFVDLIYEKDHNTSNKIWLLIAAIVWITIILLSKSIIYNL